MLFSASFHFPDLLSLEALYLSHWPYMFLNTQRLIVCLLWRCLQLSMFFLYKLHFHASLFIFMLLLIILFSLSHILLATRDTYIVLQYHLLWFMKIKINRFIREGLICQPQWNYLKNMLHMHIPGPRPSFLPQTC